MTNLPVSDGGAISDGTVIAEVSARPRIALAGEFPYFRDMKPGLSGRDVLQLQDALNRLGFLASGSIDGEYGPTTGGAVAALWKRLGYSPVLTSPTALDDIESAKQAANAAQAAYEEAKRTSPESAETEVLKGAWVSSHRVYTDTARLQGVVTPASELVNITQFPAQLVTNGVSVGDTLSGTTVLHAVSADLQITCDATDIDLEAVPANAIGTALQSSVTCNLVNLRASLQPINIPEASNDAQMSSSEIPSAEIGISPEASTSEKYAFTIQEPCDIRPGDLVVEIDLESSEANALLVPISAIYETLSSETVVHVQRGARRESIPVTVGVVVNGQAAVSVESGSLREGDLVILGAA